MTPPPLPVAGGASGLSFSATLVVIGLALQGIGVALAGVGLRKTWTEFRPESERFWDPPLKAVRRAWERAKAWSTKQWQKLWRVIRKLLRIKRPQVIKIGRGSTIESAGSISVSRGRKQFGVFSSGVETAEAVAQLDTRTRELMDRVNDLRDNLEDGTKALHEELKELQSTTERLEQDLRLRMSALRWAAPD